MRGEKESDGDKSAAEVRTLKPCTRNCGTCMAIECKRTHTKVHPLVFSLDSGDQVKDTIAINDTASKKNLN
jgi:hypothetical protein